MFCCLEEEGSYCNCIERGTSDVTNQSPTWISLVMAALQQFWSGGDARGFAKIIIVLYT